MSPIVFATRNKHKIEEINQILNQYHLIESLPEIIGLDDINCQEEIEETSSTIEGNAIQKAEYIVKNYRQHCFAEDTGLEVPALNNAPGVRSARYAGENRDPEANMQLLLEQLKHKKSRDARFKTVIALYYQGNLSVFTGIIEGVITEVPRGTGGFGYDPIFQPYGSDATFAEMSSTKKNRTSHRFRAMSQLIQFLVSTQK